jgi:pimeloyl-ACP methyl ester carboxylesterase
MRLVWKIVKYAVVTVVSLIVAIVLAALLYRAYLQHQVAEQRAIRSPQGIASMEHVRIGGIDQWIEVRGENVNNPILLWIHGGPGVAFIPLSRSFQEPIEKHFTVVQWDQRGAGKTYSSNDREQQRATMNIPQMRQDTLEVANYVRKRFGREKIFVLGHSWGSTLGLWLAHEHPELMYGYIGTGQLVSVKENREAMYRDALAAARERRNEVAIKDLEGIAPYPPATLGFRKDEIVNGWAEELLGPRTSGAGFTDIKRLLWDLVSAPEYSLADDYAFVRGQQLSLNVFLPQMADLDLAKLGLDFRTPIFLFEGKQDPFCRPSLIWEYNRNIRAPQKEFVWFENAGHFPFFDQREQFADQLTQRVLPLTTSRTSAVRD